MTLNGAIMQLVEMRENSMMPEVFKPYFDKVIETISECEEPSTMSERKKGKWLHVDTVVEENCEYPYGWMPWYCSECGGGVGKHQTAFCPNCGADMRGEKE